MGTLKKAFSSAALAGVGIAALKAVKNKKFCPVCTVKRAFSAVKLHIPEIEKYDNNVALTPPMGWSSWNAFRNTIDEDLIYDIAKAIKISGLSDAGYNYVNLDDCWQSSLRTADGKLQGDLTRFPSGIKPLVEKINALGLKVGIYTSNGTLTCEDLPASLGKEAIDADTFAEWGIEYFKYDFCHNKVIPASAPNIEYISISDLNGNSILEKAAEFCELSAGIRVVKTNKLKSGSYVTGLSSNNGYIQLSGIQIPCDGEYTLTIGIRKGGTWEKFLVVKVNGSEEYELTFPSTMAMTPDGRMQVKIHLNEGENSLKISNPVGSRMDSAFRQYRNMGRELKRATAQYAEKNKMENKPICYSICEWGLNRPWQWGEKAGNLWRTTMDIKAFWLSVVSIYEFNTRLYKYAKPGAWNDPDMLEVGNGSLTVDENIAHFSLWCMMAAPLILGNDIRSFIKEDGTADTDNKTLKILTNKELIAIDQDVRGIQAKRIKTNGICDILIKPLANKELAVCFFNKGGSEKDMSISFDEIHNDSYNDLPKSSIYIVRDLWDKNVVTVGDKISAKVPSHAVKVYRVKASG
ncbi:MAG: Alpha-galactosidase A precursor [Firmicutes bacterium ADurb.Bin300]|nr:MAG: Alpha-galactosidase A precursor [Firmicutes bacterium ADurb.Bin300]